MDPAQRQRASVRRDVQRRTEPCRAVNGRNDVSQKAAVFSAAGARTHSRLARQHGMTLVELLVAMLLGLITTYFISQVFAVAESHKRTATFGTDAQVNGAVALHTLRRHVMSAGYGVVSAAST